MANMTEEINYFIFTNLNLNLKIHMQPAYTIKQLKSRLYFLLGLYLVLFISRIVAGTYTKQVALIIFIELVSKWIMYYEISF